MPSYVNKKTRAFNAASDIQVRRKRSDGRMKTYQSATDARAWCDSTEERRQHILDLVKQGDGKGLSLGKYIPIEAIIDILLANKNADIERLQKENEDLRNFINKHGLTYQEKEQPVVVIAPRGDQAGFSSAESGREGETGTSGARSGVVGFDQASARGVDQASARGTDQASVRGTDQVSARGTDQASVRGPDQVSARGTDQASVRGPDQVSVRGADQASARGPDQANIRGPDGASISTKDSRAKPFGAPTDAAESAPKRTRRAIPDSEMEDPVSGYETSPTGDDTTPAFISDKSDNEADKGSSLYSRPMSANEKAAAEFLADKSLEEQVLALKRALAESEDLYQEQRNIAVAAMEKLENIKDIVEDKEDSNNPKQSSARTPGRLTSLKSNGPNELRAECNDLRRRLGNTDGLEDAIRRLKGKAHQEGDSKEKNELLAKIAALEKEVNNLKYKLKEIEILKVERDCLKNRLDDLSRIRKDYEELLKKTQGFDALKGECAMYKSKYEELQKMESECKELRAKVQRLDKLENERALLMKEIQDCECCMNNQEDEIKKLSCHIECLTQDLDKRQDEMKVKVITMRTHLEKKDNIIAKSEQQLANVQDQLRQSIESLSCERSCLHNRIEELEDEVKEYECKVRKYEDKVKQYEDKVKKYEVKVCENENKLDEVQINLQITEENNKALLEKLQNEKNTCAKLEEALKKAIKGDEHLKQMSKHAKSAIMCITQKLARHEIVDVAKMTAERENYDRKIKQLEDQVAKLEAAKAH